MSASGERFWTRETRAIVALAIVVVLLAVLAGGGSESRAPGPEKASTFITGDGGAAALYLTARELGVSTNQWMRPFPDDPSPHEFPVRALAIIAPDEPLLASEATWLLRWIERGGLLLYVAPRAENDEMLKALGLELGAPRWRRDPFVARPGHAKSTLGTSLLEGTPRSITGFRSTIVSVGGDPSVESLLSDDEDRMVAALLWHERGRAIVVADAGPIVNDHLRDSGMAPFLFRALADSSRGATVWFDEFHHGYDDRTTPTIAAWRFVSSTHLGWAVLQIAILAFVALVFAGIRVGRALSVAPPPRRSSLEHVEALAAAYRESAAKRRPASLLVDGLRLRFGAKSREDLTRRLEVIAASQPALHDDAKLLAQHSRNASDDADLVALTKSIDRVLEEENRVATQ
ncbi:MAG: hypothetical protein HYR85_14620 [Planctomycetes bacterium]|nr:hypothetical protein [Planctomycetota bacterium]